MSQNICTKMYYTIALQIKIALREITLFKRHFLIKTHFILINQRQHLPSTDNFSDSSGDTTTADSGRGGSDLDLSHPQRQGKTLSDRYKITL